MLDVDGMLTDDARWHILHNALDGIVHEPIAQRGGEALVVGIQGQPMGHRRLQQGIACRFLICVDVIGRGAQFVVGGAPQYAAIIKHQVNIMRRLEPHAGTGQHIVICLVEDKALAVGAGVVILIAQSRIQAPPAPSLGQSVIDAKPVIVTLAGLREVVLVNDRIACSITPFEARVVFPSVRDKVIFGRSRHDIIIIGINDKILFNDCRGLAAGIKSRFNILVEILVVSLS